MLPDIQPAHMEIIQKILKQYFPNRRIVAFGSRVIGTARKMSDLDLCIMGEESIPFGKLADLRDEFSLSNLPYKVDVISWAEIAPDFRQIVLSNHIDIQK